VACEWIRLISRHLSMFVFIDAGQMIQARQPSLRPSATNYRPSASTMLLTQHPQHIPTMLSSIHRRHPSAPPAVLVHPTHTPGLLSISKPRPTPRQQQQRPRPSPKPRQAVAHKQSPQPAHAQAREPASTSTVAPLTQTLPTPEKPLRGRSQAKDKTSRR
jgi:hypothetical protein